MKIKTYSNIIPFFIGLLEGDGSIQVNHWRSSSLQFRIIIKLKNLPSNYKMLLLIAKTLGGSVLMTNKDKFVIWVINDKNKIKEFINIFNDYPLLTGRKICQLKFLKRMLTLSDIDIYFKERANKYDELDNIIKSRPFKKVLEDEYFKMWLAGFIEAEGCFSIRKNNNHSFSISQKLEVYLFEVIKSTLNISNKLRIIKGDCYLLEVYKLETLLHIYSFLDKYPLLGEKKESYDKFYRTLFIKRRVSNKTNKCRGEKPPYNQL